MSKYLNKSLKIKIKQTQECLDLSLSKSLHLQLKELHSIARKLRKSTPEHNFLMTKIKNIRDELKGHITSIHRVSIKRGNKEYYYDFDSIPTTQDIKSLFDNYISELKQKRKERSSLTAERRDFLGFQYDVTGNVFHKKDSIIKLQSVNNAVERINKAKKPHEKIKDNFVGVELEIINQVTKDALDKMFIKENLAGYVQVKTDGSIQREDSLDITHEVAILCRQRDYKEVITKVCKVLNDPSIKGYVNNTCGMHVHLDARFRNKEVMYNNIVRALPMLTNMVPYDRVYSDWGKRYCAINNTLNFTEGANKSPTGREARYQAVNASSYDKYKTIEVRLHSGTTNAAKIINWVTILARLADCPDLITKDIKSYVEFYELFNDVPVKLIEYIKTRTELFVSKGKGADTRADHFYSNDYNTAI